VRGCRYPRRDRSRPGYAPAGLDSPARARFHRITPPRLAGFVSWSTQPFVVRTAVDLLVAALRHDHHVLEVRAADVGAVGKHDARLEAHHHVLDHHEVDVLVDQRVAVQAVAELVTGVAAVEVVAPARVADHFARARVDLLAGRARPHRLLRFLEREPRRLVD